MQRCPMWHEFAGRLLSNRRAGEASYPSLTERPLRTRILYLTSLICYNRAKKGASHLPRHIGTYLLNSGTKRRVIDVLSAFGICSSYLTAQRDLNKIAVEAKAGKCAQPKDLR